MTAVVTLINKSGQHFYFTEGVHKIGRNVHSALRTPKDTRIDINHAELTVTKNGVYLKRVGDTLFTYQRRDDPQRSIALMKDETVELQDSDSFCLVERLYTYVVKIDHGPRKELVTREQAIIEEFYHPSDTAGIMRAKQLESARKQYQKPKSESKKPLELTYSQSQSDIIELSESPPRSDESEHTSTKNENQSTLPTIVTNKRRRMRIIEDDDEDNESESTTSTQSRKRPAGAEPADAPSRKRCK